MSARVATQPRELERRLDVPRIVGARLRVGPTADRRLGERRQLVEPLVGSWVTSRSDDARSWSALEPIEVLDVSTTGAGFAAETVGMFRLGVHTSVSFGRHDVLVSVCRVTQFDPDRSIYAVRFVNPSVEFLTFVASLACSPTSPYEGG